MEFWGRHRHMMSPVRGDESAWQCTKIGAGPVPIETDEMCIRDSSDAGPEPHGRGQ